MTLGPFFHDFGVPFPIFKDLNLIDPTAIDAVTIDTLASAEIVQFQRQYAPESLITLRHLKSRNIPTIAHVDDNVWDIPPGNPARTTYQGQILDRFFYIMHEANAVTTSTVYLGKLCEKYNKNVHLFRNLVDLRMLDFKSSGRDNPEEIRIGWTTTPHHFDDWPTAQDAVGYILSTYPNAKMIFMGWLPPWCEKVPFTRFEFYDFVQVDSYYPCLANLDFDIGIAPLEDNPFNKGKTARKAQEYAALEIPMILAHTSNYKEWVHGETCLKPQNNNAEGWVKALNQMIMHKSNRIELAKRSRAQVTRNHDLMRYIWERSYVYYSVYRKVRGEAHPHEEYIINGMKERNIPIREV